MVDLLQSETHWWQTFSSRRPTAGRPSPIGDPLVVDLLQLESHWWQIFLGSLLEVSNEVNQHWVLLHETFNYCSNLFAVVSLFEWFLCSGFNLGGHMSSTFYPFLLGFPTFGNVSAQSLS